MAVIVIGSKLGLKGFRCFPIASEFCDWWKFDIEDIPWFSGMAGEKSEKLGVFLYQKIEKFQTDRFTVQ